MSGLRYCVEWWADLRVYRKPPLYSGKLCGGFETILVFMVVIHTGFAVVLLALAGGEQVSE